MIEATVNDALKAHFHMFWDHFPFPVMLVRKDRTIIDRNDAAERAGCVPGTRCVERGPLSAHKGCLANRALAENTGLRQVKFVETANMVMDVYWIPVAGHQDLFIHFGSDITPYADETLRQGAKSCDCAPS